MKKSPRLELILMAVLLVLTMLAYVWMQRRATKGQKPTNPEVAIQDGKTIDFSSGRPVVKDDAKQKAALEKSLKEMDAAAKNVTFAPRPAAEKKAEPVPAPQK